MPDHEASDVLALVKRVSPSIQVGAGFMFSDATNARGKAMGLGAFRFYFLGRGGVLGAASPDTVVAAFPFFEPSLVARMWETASAIATPEAAAAAFGDECAALGRQGLSEVPGLDAFIEVAEALIEAAPAFGMPLFAGWRAAPRAPDVAGRALQLCNVMREQRGAAHVCALVAAGVGAAEANLLRQGPESMASMGWQEPFPDVTGLEDRRARVEEMTDEALVPAFAVFDEEAARTFEASLVTIREAMARAR